MAKLALSVGLSLVVLGTVARGDVEPVGVEFQVSAYTDSYQAYPAVAAAPDGRSLIVLVSGEQGLISGQRFDSAGTRLGSEFSISAQTGTDPAASFAADGRFVVVWYGLKPGGGTAVLGQRFDGDGNPAGGIFQVNSTVPGFPVDAALSVNASGEFLVTWSSSANGGVFAQRFSSAGTKLGTQFLVHVPGSSQSSASVTALDSGDYLVVWNTLADGDGSQLGVFGRRVASSGGLLGTEFQVNSYTLGHQASPDIARTPDGGFVVAWNGVGQDGSGWGVFAQRFDASCSRIGAEFQVNVHTPFDQLGPDVAAEDGGSFFVTWYSLDTASMSREVFARHFDRMGVPAGDEFQVNQLTVYDQHYPAVAADAQGNFIVTWQTGSGATLVPPPVASARVYRVRCGNGVVDPTEQCDDGNRTDGDCCTSSCTAEADGPASCDANDCTRQDVCTDGVCIPGPCAVGQPCTICGGTCEESGPACECFL